MRNPSLLSLRYFFAAALMVFVLVAGSAGLRHLWEGGDNTAHPDIDHREVCAVVSSLMGACVDADYERAFLMNVSGTRNHLSVADYEQTMRQRFNRIVVARRIDFGAVAIEKDSAFVEVYLVGHHHDLHLALFLLAREADGWKIDSIRIEPLPDLTLRHPIT